MPTCTICQDLFRFAHTHSPVAPAAARQVTVRAGDATTRSEASAGRGPRLAICSLRARHTSAVLGLRVPWHARRSTRPVGGHLPAGLRPASRTSQGRRDH